MHLPTIETVPPTQSGAPSREARSTGAHAPRVVSIDALRGFIMFWIVGGDELFLELRNAFPRWLPKFIPVQLNHRPWQGVSFYDLIFPLFIFIVGVSLVFSLSGTLEQKGRKAAMGRVLSRSTVLFLLGVFFYGGISDGWDQIRWLGVLQRIALCFLFSGLSFCYFKPPGLIAICGVLMVGYWAAMTFIPIRDINLESNQLKELCDRAGDMDAEKLFRETNTYVTGRFENGLNLAHHIDFQYLPGRKWEGAYDPEGILSTVPAIASCLLGVLSGLLLKTARFNPQRKVYFLIMAGVAGIVLGQLWGLQFPIIKKLWTSSYVLLAGGWCCLFLAAFYQAIDIWHWRKWCVPFLWLGMNSIAIYLVYHLIELDGFADRIVGGPIKTSLGAKGEALTAATVMLMVLALVRSLYRRKIFLKL